MKAIVAVYEDWGIGCEGKMMHNIPEDMKFFRNMTKGKVVVMGRKTLESFPNKQPLKNRINIVLTGNQSFKDDRLIICHSIDETLGELKKHDDNDVFIIGGETIYKQFLPYCKKAYVTKISRKYTADTFFLNLDKDQNWELIRSSSNKKHNGIKYKFTVYANKKFGSEK